MAFYLNGNPLINGDASVSQPKPVASTSVQPAAAQPTASTNNPGFLDKLKQYISTIKNVGEDAYGDAKAAKDAAYRSASFGLLNKGKAAVMATGQPGIDFPASENASSFKQRYENILNGIHQEVANEIGQHPISTTVGDIAGTGADSIALGGVAAPALEEVAGALKNVPLVKKATNIPFIGKIIKNLGHGVEAAAKSIPDVGINAAQGAGENSNGTDGSVAAGGVEGGIEGVENTPTEELLRNLGIKGIAAEAIPGLADIVGNPYVRAITTGLGGAAIDNISHPDNEVDVDKTLSALGINPDSADGTQKAAQLNPTDLSHQAINNTEEGQPVSPDVPQVTIQNGKQVQVLPNGTVIPVS